MPSRKILQEIFQLNEEELKLFEAIDGNIKIIKKSVKCDIDFMMLDHFAFKKSCHKSNIKNKSKILF